MKHKWEKFNDGFRCNIHGNIDLELYRNGKYGSAYLSYCGEDCVLMDFSVLWSETLSETQNKVLTRALDFIDSLRETLNEIEVKDES